MTRRSRRAAFGLLSTTYADTSLVRRAVDEIWNAGNIEVADELFSSTYINHGGLIPDLVKGPEGIKFGVALYRTAFPGLHIRIDSLSLIEGTVHMRWTAQSSSAVYVKQATGALHVDHEFSGSVRSSIVAGRIVESWTTWDSTAALQVLEARGSSHEESS